MAKASPHTKFTANDILDIREAQGRAPVRELADYYGVAPSTIWKIWRGETFRHVGKAGDSPVEQKPFGQEPTREEILESQAKLKKLLDEQGLGDQMIGEIEEGENNHG